MGCNNPIVQVIEEAELVFDARRVACVISIGTGKAETIAIPSPSFFQLFFPFDVVIAMRGIATDCERNAQEVARHFQGMPNVYFRFNVEQGMQTIGLGQWEQLDRVATHTSQYMRMQDVDDKLDAAVSGIRKSWALPTVQASMEAV
jgi:hypothetical protein